MEVMRVKDIIEELMSSQDVTQYRLSEDTGIPKSTINSIMTGKSKNPGDEIVDKLAAFFELTNAQIRGYEAIESFGDFNSHSERKLSQVIPVIPNAMDQIKLWMNDEIGRSDIARFCRSSFNYSAKTFAISCPDDAVNPVLRTGEIGIVDPEPPEHVKLDPGVVLVNKNGNYSFRHVVNDLGEIRYAATSNQYANLTPDECTVIGYLAGLPEHNWTDLTEEERRIGEKTSKLFN